MKFASLKNVSKLILIFLIMICAFKILLVGYDIDEQYAISMSYRLIQNDSLVMDMWEPHQTSAYLIALFMLPYITITGSLTGIVLYLRICGLMIHTIVSYFLYKYLKRMLTVIPGISDKTPDYAFLLTCIYFFSLPKLMFLPEFSNMQLWFLLLTILHLLNYYQTDTIYHLVCAGCFITLEVLTYPSTIIAFFVILLYIVLYHRKNNILKELIAFLSPCVLSFIAFLGYLLSRMSLSQLINNIRVISQDGSHSAPFLARLETNARSLGEIILFLLLYGTIATVLFFLLRKSKKIDKAEPLVLFHLLFIGTALIGQLVIWIFGSRYPNYPSVEYFLLPILGIYFAQKKKETHSHLFSFFVIVPLSAFIGIIAFTNHPLLVSAPFLSLCITGILCIYCKHINTNYKSYHGLRYVLILWVLVLIFGKTYMIRTSDGLHYTLFHDVSLIRKGPAIGIIADTNTVKQYNDAWDLAESYLPAEANVFYAGRSVGIYLFKNMEICTPSTISTPTYDEKTQQYFTLHPDKNPEYIICDNNLRDLQNDSWLAEYLDSKCSAPPIQTYYYSLYYVDK